MNKRVAAALVAATVFLTPAIAAAACKQSDLIGIWRFHWIANDAQWIYCTIEVKANGAFFADRPCVAHGSVQTTIMPGAKLTMTIPGRCKIGGSFRFYNSGSPKLFTFADGVMSKGLDTVLLVGENPEHEPFSIHLTKL